MQNILNKKARPTRPIRPILPTFLTLLALLLLASCTARVRDGGQLTRYEKPENAPPVVQIQNERLRLEFLTETAELVLTDLSTSHEWRSTPEGIANDQKTSAVERFNAQSLFLLAFERETGAETTYDSYRYSVRDGLYEFEVIDNTLELRFTVGDFPKTFYVPDAIYKDRLDGFIERLERTPGRRVIGEYTPVSLASLPPSLTREGALAKFPMLEDGSTIYVLNDDIPEFRMERVYEGLTAAGYTYEDWLDDQAYFGLVTELQQAAFNIIMRFELDENNMILTIPMSEIAYVPQFMPTRLTVMPYFGAARVEDEGYLFVPDGSGSVMYFDSQRNTQSLYFSRMYGHDEAIVLDSVLHDNRSAYPVFGIYRNGATFAAIIDEGAAYASVTAENAGMRAEYSRVHSIFRLLHGAPLDVKGRSNDSMYMHEWQLPQEDIVIRYAIPTGDGYVGMAHAFRDFLQARYPNLQERAARPVDAMVEILGGALSPQHILGFPVDRPFPLTTYEQAADILQALHDFGWRNLHVKMRGAHNKSIDHLVPTSLELIPQLGGRSGFGGLLASAERLGYEFYLEGDFVRMRGDKGFDGFRPMRDAARQANRERVAHAGYSDIYFGRLGTSHVWADPTVLARPEFTIKLAENFAAQAEKIGVSNIAFRSMASVLAGDFNEDKHVTREASLNMRADLLARLRENGTGIWLNYGFSYAAPYADIITGMPVSDQGFAITDVTVPFYQIALHGLVPFAGVPLNLSEDYSYNYLRSVESGSALFFSFMNVPTADLLVTRYRRYFANEFGRWAEVANELYARHERDLGHLYNQLIVGHEILSRDGVSVTVYEDGTRVFVNTGLVDFVTDSGITVGARDYVVRR
ncbi:MAG: DUF5696 domain-containing protein [Defluviitaleaceae bacterium]|nr:DUF5696 domain-containing protein [Defluviitaleaceae bacterium]